jgi:hypothetical protein
MWAEQQFAKRRQKRGYIAADYRLFETAVEESPTAEEDRPLVRVKRKSEQGLCCCFNFDLFIVLYIEL